jgi:hypothetical protein
MACGAISPLYATHYVLISPLLLIMRRFNLHPFINLASIAVFYIIFAFLLALIDKPIRLAVTRMLHGRRSSLPVVI